MSRRNPWFAVAGGAAVGLLAGLAVSKRRRTLDLNGQVVLITGGSRGLGLALAREFGSHGCSLAICSRDAEQLERAKSILESEGFEAFAVVCDVSDASQVSEMVRRVTVRYGRVDILVNNAGEIIVGPVANMTAVDFDRAMNVMFWGVLHTTLAVLPQMRERQAGRIATITSIGGKVAVPHLLPYSCAKFAAVAFSEGLRAEEASNGIKVTTIAPGLMRTGSDVNAYFKGRHSSEAAWFSAAASMPLVAMKAERAAAKIVTAIKQGRAEVVLSPQAKALAHMQGLLPGLTSDILSFVNQFLPAPVEGCSLTIRGMDLIADQGKFMQLFTYAGRKAGESLNQTEG